MSFSSSIVRAEIIELYLCYGSDNSKIKTIAKRVGMSTAKVRGILVIGGVFKNV